ncbi:MAG: pknB 22 [Acidobacteria bacterium]|nr:pknB 22 [Acidobacteriota bacterium]
MPLTAGSRLSAYEIIAAIGAGGMGEVYRARDTKLNRDVAIKVLLPAVANDPDRLARFNREAQVLASLNHPNIAHIHGLEEAGGVTALVLELVEGEDLAQRIARGPIPIDEALPIARQIADALEAAHEQGIVHRDLKPANIKVRPDGTVKVLDFGLAKAMDPAAASSANAMNSPTLSMHATQAGIILGTAAYMSPEQARGKAVDKRADVWAFGVVLFEMLAGTRAFGAEDISLTLAFVMTKEPEWAALPPSTTPALRAMLRRCLDKEPKRRLQSIGEARVQIEDLISGASADGVTGVATPATPELRMPNPVARWRHTLPWAITTAAAAAAAVLMLWAPWRHAPGPKPVRFTVAPAGAMPLPSGGPFRDLALSPDGEQLVYTTRIGVQSSGLWVRSFDQLAAVQVRGLTSPQAPFISADSKWIGFFTPGEIKKVSMSGGPAISVCRFANGGTGSDSSQGASWGQNDTIIFATTNLSTGLLSVSATGAEPTVLTRPDQKQGELDHVFPSFLPGSQAVLFTITNASGLESSQVAVLDLKTGQRKILIRGGGAAEYVGSGQGGYLVYAVAGALRAVRFDPVRLDVLSNPVAVLDQVTTKSTGAAEFSVSPQGALAYLPGGVAQIQGAEHTLVWVDGKGHEEAIKAPPRAYQRGTLSPDGTRIALDVRDQENDIWIWDLVHDTLTRLTADPAPDSFPVWTTDSRRIIFSSARNGAANLYWQLADGSGPVERLTTSPNNQAAMSAAPDGSGIIVRETRASADLFLMRLDGKRELQPLLQSAFQEHNGVISPDGRWLAYDSNDSGQAEVYVRPYPNVNGGHWQVSTRGGDAPLWAPNGRELFYVDATDHLTRVPVQTPANGVFNFGSATKLLDTAYYPAHPTRNYDISRNRQTFLMIKDGVTSQPGSPAAAPASMIVVLNWFEELKARVR